MAMVWNEEEEQRKRYETWLRSIQGTEFQPAKKAAFRIWLDWAIRMRARIELERLQGDNSR